MRFAFWAAKTRRHDKPQLHSSHVTFHWGMLSAFASGWGQGELVGARLRLIKRQRGVHSVEEVI